MYYKIFRFGFALTVFLMMMGMQSIGQVATAYGMHSTVTFENQSGEDALVKLVGPSPRSVEVRDKESRTVSVGDGTYHILTRYGTGPDNYRYSRGESFSVSETPPFYEVIRITLHGVVNGNYETFGSSQAEFERAP